MKAIINGKIILKDRIVENNALLYSDVIEGIVPADKLPEGVEVIDAKGGYVAPGLIDLHIHGYLGEDASDGSFNGNRIYIGDFLGGNPDYASQSQHAFKITNYTSNEEDGYQIVNDTDEYNALLAKVDSTFVLQNSAYGTEYAQSLEYCYNLLNATKADGNKQFCVFMSDGIPNVFQYGENSKYESTKTLAEMFTGTLAAASMRCRKAEYLVSLPMKT